MPFVKRKKQSIDYAPIKQTPFADYWAGEHAVTNDPNMGPWSPKDYEKYKYTTKAEWLKTHPEDWQLEDILTAPSAQKAFDELKQGLGAMAQAENPAWEMTKGMAAGVADLPSGIKQRWDNPVRFYGENPLSALTDILTALGITGAARIPKGLTGAERLIGGSTVESATAKALESPEAMFSRYNPGKVMGQKALPPASAETAYTDLQKTFEPRMQRADRLAVAQREQFVNQLLAKLKTEPPPRMLPPGKATPMGPTAESLRGKYSSSLPIDQSLLAGAEKEQFIKQLMDKLSAPEQRLLPETTGGTPRRAWESSQVMSRKYDPALSSTDQPIFDVEAASLDAAMKEVDNILGGTRTAYISKEARMKNVLDQIYELLGKKKP